MWLRIDERIDVVSSVAECARALSAIVHDETAWKWVIISLHSALQGAMVCHLSGTAQLGAMSQASINEWLAWRERDLRGEIHWIEERDADLGIPSLRPASRSDRAPTLYVATPAELFRRLHKAKKRFEIAGSILPLTSSQGWSFRKLNSLRNAFIHFAPRGWSIELSGMPHIVDTILQIIEAISVDPWPFRHCSPIEREQLQVQLLAVRSELSRI